MPNWIKNQIIFKGKDASNKVSKLLSLDNEGDIMFDFNKIIPMPEDLNVESSSLTDDVMDYILYNEPELLEISNEELQKIYQTEYYNTRIAHLHNLRDYDRMFRIMESEGGKEKYFNFGKQSILNILKYGYPNWSYWCNANWRTKWNACYTRFVKANENECEVYFETAWSCPFKIIVKLSEMFKDLDISGQWANEDIGSNCGIYFKDNGEIEFIFYENCSKKAYETYIDLWGNHSELAFNEEKDNYELIED